MELKERAGTWFEKLKGFGVKEWGAILLAGICCLIIVFPAKGEEKTIQQAERQETIESIVPKDYVETLEERLTELLASVENVGEVKVMITVKSTTEKTVLQDGTKEEEKSTEKDSAGGSRVSENVRTEGNTVFTEEDGSGTPYILQETYPEITGVVVIAAGSGKGTVDYDILNAVQVLFDVPAHKIKIMKMK